MKCRPADPLDPPAGIAGRRTVGCFARPLVIPLGRASAHAESMPCSLHEYIAPGSGVFGEILVDLPAGGRRA